MAGAVKVSDDALLGVLAAFRTLEKDQKKAVQTGFKRTAVPLFRKAYTQRARTPQMKKAAGIGAVTLSQGGSGAFKGYSTSSKVLSGGLNPAGGQWPFIEFGSKQPGYGGTRLPYWQKSGRIFFSAADATIGVVQRLYIRVTYDLFRDLGAEG